MEITPIHTRTLIPPQDDFFSALADSLTQVPERSIIALSSKAVAIGEGRCIPLQAHTDVRALKERLAQQESDYFVRREAETGRHFTIIHGSLMGSAGIDESNGNDHLILWPQDPMQSARDLLARLRAQYAVRELGVVITDSHSIPLHNGAIGLAIGYAGFAPLKDYRGSLDLFGRAFKVERANIADSLAVAASYVMGEGNESTPAALMTNLPQITFSEEISNDPYLQLTISKEEDYFRTFLDSAEWEKGGGGFEIGSDI